ncbi:hypothetical protein HUT18_10475 [Streptomyces sp. NA04227]|uniref:hypothetical protein n=1 Tax=Streptomyces sp. NA04227 TaxID=2742136 RepID=UPI00158FEA34|nr:hypothetical protein [Streptomyces sp. NA04227]QKW06752.1 hypothetical protein HUT18_10475 [Streptomyces sp. NA04227]
MKSGAAGDHFGVRIDRHQLDAAKVEAESEGAEIVATIPARSAQESRAMRFLAACTLVPILCLAFQDIGSKHGGMEWLNYHYVAWPMMIAPVLMLILFFRNRELIRDPRIGANFSQTIKLVAVLYLVWNIIGTIGYSWLGVISVLSCLTILVADWQLKKRARA